MLQKECRSYHSTKINMPVEPAYRRKPQRSHMSELRRINTVLERYYENNGRRHGEYRNRHGVGHFMEYVQTEQLDDEYNGSIVNELGDAVNPRDSAYGWMCKRFDFPVPAGVHLPRTEDARATFCFYVLQYCWKYNRAPTAKYIREYIVPKLVANHGHSMRPNSTFRLHVDRDARSSRHGHNRRADRSPSTTPSDQQSPPPRAYPPTIPMSPPPGPKTVCAPKEPSPPIPPKEPTTVEGHPTCEFVLRKGRVRILAKRQFVPAHAPRAHLNIFTSKEVIFELLPRVAEPFPNESSLYYYTDITSALQMNDGEVAEYTLKRIDFADDDTKPATKNKKNGNTDDGKDHDDEEGDETTKEKEKPCEPERVCFVNYDLHLKSNGESLYGVVVPNERDKSNGNKWRWQLAAVLTASEINEFYEVVQGPSHYRQRGHGYNGHHSRWKLTLPSSSRRMTPFLRQLSQRLVIREELMRTTDWFAVQQIKSLQRATRRKLKEQRQDEPVSVRCSLSRAQWVQACTASFADSRAPLIPCVLAKNHQHWIEWVKLVALPTVGLYVGVSLKLEQLHGGERRWSVQSLLLDPGDIRNKHRLTGLRDNRYIAQMEPFTVSLVELVFTDNHKQSVEKKLRDAKLQIKAQQDSIVRLKERLLREQRSGHGPHRSYLETRLTRPDDDHDLVLCGDDDVDHKEAYDLALIVDAVLKDESESSSDTTSSSSGSSAEEQKKKADDEKVREVQRKAERKAAQRMYMVLPFDFFSAGGSPQISERRTLGAKNNILIAADMVSEWLPKLPRFATDASLYYWLDMTVALQMAQGFAVQFVARKDSKFLAALLNFELAVGGEDLYGVVSENRNVAKDSHPFKLVALMTAEEIRDTFGFLSSDLPAHSRRNSAFRSWLRLPRSIAEHDLIRHPLNAHCLKILAPQSTTTCKIPIVRVDVLMSVDVLRRYILNEVEKVHAGVKGKRLIPILCVDKMRGDVHMEWVLLVELLAEGRTVGVSFRFNQSKDAYVAKAVYLDSDELERKHLLVGLKHNLCIKYLPRMPPFNVGCLRVVPGCRPSSPPQRVAMSNANANQMQMMRQQMAMQQMQLQQLQQAMSAGMGMGMGMGMVSNPMPHAGPQSQPANMPGPYGAHSAMSANNGFPQMPFQGNPTM